MRAESPIDWQIATVTSITSASPRVKLFQLEFETETKFRAGQYFDIRLTAPDGYQAQRSYSVSSSPSDSKKIELTIELIDDGEVSSYFHELVDIGDKIELRGPIGGHFTISPNFSKPTLLIAGGSGVAPIMSMLRQRHLSNNSAPIALLFSTRTELDVLFRDELESIAQENPNVHIIIALTRSGSTQSRPSIGAMHRDTKRIDRPMIDSAIAMLGETPARAYVCGGSSFVEAMGNYLLESGMAYDDVRTERFGP